MSISVVNSVQGEPQLAPMQTGKAKGWLGEYHWVTPAVTEKNKYSNLTDEANKWCKDHFGKSGHRWFEKEQKFYFKSEKDMSLFILRWS